MAPRGLFTPFGSEELVRTAGFLASTGAIVALGVGMRRARRRVLSEQCKLAMVLGTINDQLVMLDREWRYTYVNDRALEATGRRLDELLGRILWDLYPGLLGTEFERAARTALAEQRPAHVEFYYAPRSNWLECRFYPSRDGIALLVNDVAGQRRTENELAKRVAEQSALYVFTDRLQRAPALEQVCDAALDAIVTALGCSRASILLFDQGGVPRFVAWRGISDGYRQAVDGHSPWLPGEPNATPIWIPDLAEADLSPALRATIAAEGIRALAFIPLIASGALIGKFMVYYDGPHPRAQEEEHLALTIARQLAFAVERQRAADERRRTVEALLVNEERLRLALHAGKLGVWDWDIEANILSWSDSLYPMHGVTREEFRGTLEFFEALVHPDDRSLVARAIERALADEKRLALEFRVVRRDGETVWVYTDAAVIRQDGRPSRMMGATVDITERKRAEQSLLDANRRKDEFLATLAHELRNPLAPLVNMLHLMQRTNGNDALQAEARDTMERQLKHLVRLVDDLLDVGRITRNRLELRRERVELTAVIRQALDGCRSLIDQFEQQLTVALPAEPIYVDADPVRLVQVFGNLLNNACKFTPRGGQITLAAGEESGNAVVSVADTGVGIDPDMVPRVFDLFAQVDGSLEHSRGGLGIGLTLVKQLVEMHGGRVEAESHGPGSGSRFTVRLPALAGSPSDEPRPVIGPPPVTEPRRVLVVDDNRDAAESLAKILRIVGHEPFLAHDGLQAVEEAERLRPDIILLDLGLPLLNGFDTCHRIRQEPWGAHMVLIAITGWGQEDYRRRSDQAGFDDHLVKPVQPSQLLDVIAATTAKASAASLSIEETS
jgi:PAS domain S-box-containing protein